MPTPTLRVQLTRRTDGAVVFRCLRADGTSTWQRHAGATAHFFPAHDLTHFAVERTLGLADAFYGLVASGWDLDDFGKPWPRGPLPAEALRAELVVGFLDRERAAFERWPAAEFMAHADAYCAEHHIAPLPALDDATLDAARDARDALLARWSAVADGGTLELAWPDEFGRAGAPAAGADRAPRGRTSG